MALISTAPTDPVDQFAQRVAAMERRIADLERVGSRGPRYSSGTGAPSGTGTNGQLYYDNTNDRLYASDGAGWIVMYEPRQTYVPTTTNISNGSGFSMVATYQRSGGWCDVNIVHVLGVASAGVITAPGPTWTLPKTAALISGASFNCGGACMLYDASGAIQRLEPFLQSGTLLEPRVVITNPALQQVSNTVPITIAVSDFFELKPRYQMATPYL